MAHKIMNDSPHHSSQHPENEPEGIPPHVDSLDVNWLISVTPSRDADASHTFNLAEYCLAQSEETILPSFLERESVTPLPVQSTMSTTSLRQTAPEWLWAPLVTPSTAASLIPDVSRLVASGDQSPPPTTPTSAAYTGLFAPNVGALDIGGGHRRRQRIHPTVAEVLAACHHLPDISSPLPTPFKFSHSIGHYYTFYCDPESIWSGYWLCDRCQHPAAKRGSGEYWVMRGVPSAATARARQHLRIAHGI
ncbi:hypothetical protein P7C70_g8063, partial [Phenoliferia sp. Uapishka_3]